MEKKILTIFCHLTLVSLSGCGSSEPDTGTKKPDEPKKERLQIVAFSGFRIPGDAAIAKADGFVQCSKEYSHYKCVKEGNASLLDIKVDEAFVELSTADAFQPNYSSASTDVSSADAQSLSYRSVYFKLPMTVIDEACVRKAKPRSDWLLDPPECVRPGGITGLKEKLEAEGWSKLDPISRYSTYYKPETLVQITIHQETVEVEPLPPREAQDIWTRIKEKNAKESASESKAQNFINSMNAESK